VTPAFRRGGLFEKHRAADGRMGAPLRRGRLNGPTAQGWCDVPADCDKATRG
jgi:hypothetical protein